MSGTVPNTTTFSLQDVQACMEYYDSLNQYTNADLQQCFDHAVSSSFDPASIASYPADSMLRFRNYANFPAPTHAVGDAYQGGEIAYLLANGDAGFDPWVQHGLITATSDQSTGIVWAISYGSTTTFTAIGYGNYNTNSIVSAQGAGTYAAKLCSDLSLNGYTDWCLPSYYELIKLYINNSNFGGFSNADYWASSEVGNYTAYSLSFINGSTSAPDKLTTCHVRAIRSF
jgi:hypothetical protein